MYILNDKTGTIMVSNIGNTRKKKTKLNLKKLIKHLSEKKNNFFHGFMHFSRENLVKYILHDFHTLYLIEYDPCFNSRHFICVLLKFKKEKSF